MVPIEPGLIKRVAIIGAGPSGLATAKYLRAEDVFSEIIIYEQRSSVGGTWNYTPLSSQRQEGITGDRDHHAEDVVTANLATLNTPMYDGLESNLPHMLMQFSDTPFPEGTQLFAARETVLQYLHDYANDIIPMVRFEHQVVDVRPTRADTTDEHHGWKVTTESIATGETTIETFDAVVAANGHCEWPLLPEIEGIDAWSKEHPESLYHSVSYKNSKIFKNKRVLLVGGGPSGADIGHQIARVCHHPLLVARKEKSPYHDDEPYALIHPTLVALKPHDRAAIFDDGSVERNIDIIILCTGYAYSFPFLSPIDSTIQDEGLRTLPLYQYIFHTHHPTLAFVETPEKIVPFPLAECQAAVIARVWSGRLALPTLHDMETWRDSIIRERGGGGRAFHALTPPLDLDYMKSMYDWIWSCEADAEAEAKKDSKTTTTTTTTTNDQEVTRRGKVPKRWDEKACWERMMAAEMKKAFQARGKERGKVLRYEELGFRFDGTGDNA